MSFLAKAIDRAQRLPLSDPFCLALHEYIFRQGAMLYDPKRNLFWVNHPQTGYQVAVWTMEQQ